MYTKNNILSYIKNDIHDVIILNEIDSTNNYAKENIEKLDAGSLVIAKKQLGGRGRRGRSFLSPEGGLYFSIITTADSSLCSGCFPTVVTAVSVCRAIEECCGLSCDIKWVNDIYLNGKKLCGILCESTSVNDKIIIGIGININKPVNGFSKEISDIATALSEHVNSIDSSKLIAVVYNNIMTHSPDFNIKSVIDEYRTRSFVINKDIYVLKNEEKIKAKAIGITDSGELTVEYPDKTKENLFYGDISVKLNI